MRHDPHSYIRATEAIAPASLSDAPFYPEDLLPALQNTLAALADLEVGFEIARDSLEECPGSEEENSAAASNWSRLTALPASRSFATSLAYRSRSEKRAVSTDPARLERTPEGAVCVQ